MRVLREHTKSKKFDLERSSYVGQINKAQNANLKIAIINCGLFFIILSLVWVTFFDGAPFVKKVTSMEINNI